MEISFLHLPSDVHRLVLQQAIDPWQLVLHREEAFKRDGTPDHTRYATRILGCPMWKLFLVSKALNDEVKSVIRQAFTGILEFMHGQDFEFHTGIAFLKLLSDGWGNYITTFRDTLGHQAIYIFSLWPVLLQSTFLPNLRVVIMDNIYTHNYHLLIRRNGLQSEIMPLSEILSGSVDEKLLDAFLDMPAHGCFSIDHTPPYATFLQHHLPHNVVFQWKFYVDINKQWPEEFGVFEIPGDLLVLTMEANWRAADLDHCLEDEIPYTRRSGWRMGCKSFARSYLYMDRCLASHRKDVLGEEDTSRVIEGQSSDAESLNLTQRKKLPRWEGVKYDAVDALSILKPPR